MSDSMLKKDQSVDTMCVGSKATTEDYEIESSFYHTKDFSRSIKGTDKRGTLFRITNLKTGKKIEKYDKSELNLWLKSKGINPNSLIWLDTSEAKKIGNPKYMTLEQLESIANDPYFRGIDGADYDVIREEIQERLWKLQNDKSERDIEKRLEEMEEYEEILKATGSISNDKLFEAARNAAEAHGFDDKEIAFWQCNVFSQAVAKIAQYLDRDDVQLIIAEATWQTDSGDCEAGAVHKHVLLKFGNKYVDFTLKQIDEYADFPYISTKLPKYIKNPKNLHIEHLEGSNAYIETMSELLSIPDDAVYRATASYMLTDLISKALNEFQEKAKQIGWENPEHIANKVMAIAEQQQSIHLKVSPHKKIVYEKTKADNIVEKTRVKNACKNYLKSFLRDFIGRLNSFKSINDWVDIKAIVEPFIIINWDSIEIATSTIKFKKELVNESDAESLPMYENLPKYGAESMKKLLEKHGIKVNNGKIAKSDLDKAIKVISCNISELMPDGKKLNEEFSTLFAQAEKDLVTLELYKAKADVEYKVGDLVIVDDKKKGKIIKIHSMGDMADVDFGNGDVYGIMFNRMKLDNAKACMDELLLEGKELETKKLDKLLVDGKKDKTMKGLTETKEVLEDELSKIYADPKKPKIVEKIEELVVNSKVPLNEKDFYAKASKKAVAENATKNEFMKKFLKDSSFKVIDGVGIKKMKNGNIAKLSLETGGTSGKYTRLVLVIINKKDGQVDSKSFNFADNLIADKKNTHPNAKKVNSALYVWDSHWDWYIDYPTTDSIKDLFSSIDEYVDHFDDAAE